MAKGIKKWKVAKYLTWFFQKDIRPEDLSLGKYMGFKAVFIEKYGLKFPYTEKDLLKIDSLYRVKI